jgi:hypothetical protein
MPSRTSLRLHPNADWPGIIDRLLGRGTHAEHKAARETMWVEVQHYVVYCARLPIGPLNEDEEARRDIAVSLLRRLEHDDFRHVREWKRRQRSGQDHAAWWGWVQLMASSLGIDFARGSRQNVARRGKPFRWVRITSVDPHLLPDMIGDPLRKSLEFLDQCGADDLVGYLTELQDALSVDARPADPPEPCWSAVHAPRPDKRR